MQRPASAGRSGSGLAALPLGALAESPQAARITIDCAQPTLPSQRDVARLTGIANFSQLYAARSLINAQRNCKRPHADTTLLVLEPATQPADRRAAIQARR